MFCSGYGDTSLLFTVTDHRCEDKKKTVFNIMSHTEKTGGGSSDCDDDEKFPPNLDVGGGRGGFVVDDVNNGHGTGFEGIGGIFGGGGGGGDDFPLDGIEDIFNDDVIIDGGNISNFGAVPVVTGAGAGAGRHNSILQVEAVLLAAEKAAGALPPPGEAGARLQQPPPPAATNNNNSATATATRNNSILQVENALMEADPATSIYQEAIVDSSGNEDDDEDQEVDRILAQDLHELSVEERNQAMFDLHGIIVLTPEEPAEIAQMLLTMEQEVRRIVTTHKNTAPTAAAAAPGGTGNDLDSTLAYAVAECMSWEYVHDSKFRLMFIRADRYDPIKAAKRLVDFFDIKQTLFGREKLCKDITLMDLFEDDETRTCLESGYCQRSRYRDAGGRPIVVNNGIKANSFSASSRRRVSYFVHMMAVMNDDDAQRRGVIWIIDDMDSNTTNSSQKVRDVLPVYFGAIHGCFPGTTRDSAGRSFSVHSSTSSSFSSSSASSSMTSSVAAAAAAVQQQLKSEDARGNGRSMRVVDNVVNWRETIKSGMSQNQRVRLRKHYGTKSEIVQALTTYGIPHQVTSLAHIDMIQWLQSLLGNKFSNSSPQTMVNDGHSSIPNGTTQFIQNSTFHPEGNISSTGGSFPSSQQILTLQGSNGIQSNSIHASAEGKREMSMDIPPQVTVRSDDNGVVAAQRVERRSSSQMPFHNAPSDMILVPSDDDVLFGRGRISVDHPGNVRFKQLVEMNMDVYYSPNSTRSTKAQIARTIVNTLTESGGRFLRKVTNNNDNNSSNVDGQDVNKSAVAGVEYWVEVDHKEAQAKCAHQFRNGRQKMK